MKGGKGAYNAECHGVCSACWCPGNFEEEELDD